MSLFRSTGQGARSATSPLSACSATTHFNAFTRRALATAAGEKKLKTHGEDGCLVSIATRGATVTDIMHFCFVVGAVTFSLVKHNGASSTSKAGARGTGPPCPKLACLMHGKEVTSGNPGRVTPQGHSNSICTRLPGHIECRGQVAPASLHM